MSLPLAKRIAMEASLWDHKHQRPFYPLQTLLTAEARLLVAAAHTPRARRANLATCMERLRIEVHRRAEAG